MIIKLFIFGIEYQVEVSEGDLFLVIEAFFYICLFVLSIHHCLFAISLGVLISFIIFLDYDRGMLIILVRHYISLS